MFYPVQNFITAACCFSSRTKAAQTNTNTFCCLLEHSMRVARRRSQGPAWTCWCFERSTRMTGDLWLIRSRSTVLSCVFNRLGLVTARFAPWVLWSSWKHGPCSCSSHGHGYVKAGSWSFFYGSEVTWGYSYGHQWELMGKWWEIVIIYSIMAQLTLSFWACFMIYTSYRNDVIPFMTVSWAITAYVVLFMS